MAWQLIALSVSVNLYNLYSAELTLQKLLFSFYKRKE